MTADFSDRTVAIIGLARTGLAVAEALARHGARVMASDTRPAEELQEVQGSLPAGVELEAGGHARSVAAADLIVVSPGVPRALPLLQAAEADGVELIGEIELAYRLAASPIVAITGTNGKTTTTTLVARILAEAGLDAPLGGNIGIPLVTLAEQPCDYLVAEVSSFQLETVVDFRPKVGAWLNFTDDHLNRHGSREVYFELKKQLFARQTASDWAVLNADDPAVSSIRGELAGQVLLFSRRQDITGVIVEGGWIVWRKAGSTLRVMPVSDILLRGDHNLENCLAATAIALALGVAAEVIARAIAGFGGVEHRIEPVRTLNGVQWYNDSKGTNYDSTVKAIASFAEPLVLIAGGRDKGGAIAPLIEAISRRVEHVVLLGEAGPYFERVLRAAGYEALTLTDSLEGAVAMARTLARPGGVVLFSPACTSFDMFKNYEERGSLFKKAVMALEPGEVARPAVGAIQEEVSP